MFAANTHASQFNATTKQQRNHLLLRDEDQFYMDSRSNTDSNPVSVTNGGTVKRQ